MAKDLTQGKIMPMLIKFTIPLILGNIFQLTYNAVDSIVVGKFVGKEALAAVGICNPITTLLILFLNGLCMGASILMGNYFGGKKMDTLSRQISTTMVSGMVFSLVLALVTIVFAKPILILVQVDRSIMTLTTQYLRIIMLGLIFTFLYNFLSSTLRALGDSTTPLYFLIISAALNVVGDIFFVVVLKAGSNGCAVATVVSEALCCVFCMVYIKFRVPILCLGKKWFVFDRSLLKTTIKYGWVSAMQQATVQLGKIGIQAIINTMGVSVSAAFAVVNRIDDYAYTPEQNIAHGMTAMMAQNKGAGKDDRVIKGFKAGMVLEILYAIFIFFVCFCVCNAAYEAVHFGYRGYRTWCNLPQTYLCNVCTPGAYQWHSGIFQRNRRPEDYSDFKHYQYGASRTCCNSPCIWARYGNRRRFPSLILQAGWYAYCGNAFACQKLQRIYQQFKVRSFV